MNPKSVVDALKYELNSLRLDVKILPDWTAVPYNDDTPRYYDFVWCGGQIKVSSLDLSVLNVDQACKFKNQLLLVAVNKIPWQWGKEARKKSKTA